MEQYTSLCESTAVLSCDVIDIGDGVSDRVQIECGREEVHDGEKQEKDKHEETNNAQAHIMDEMKME